MEASNAGGGVGINRDCLMTGAVRTTSATIHCAVYCTHRHASVNLFITACNMDDTTKRREENRIYLYAVVNLKQK